MEASTTSEITLPYAPTWSNQNAYDAMGFEIIDNSNIISKDFPPKWTFKRKDTIVSQNLGGTCSTDNPGTVDTEFFLPNLPLEAGKKYIAEFVYGGSTASLVDGKIDVALKDEASADAKSLTKADSVSTVFGDVYPDFPHTYSFKAPQTTKDYRLSFHLTGTCVTTGYEVTLKNIIVKEDPGPLITTQPEDIALSQGGNGSFTVEATGDNLTYQWYGSKDGVDTALSDSDNLSGTKTKTLSITNATSDLLENDYYCKVTNSLGDDTSDMAYTSRLKHCTISFDSDEPMIYNGEAYTPAITVKNGDKSLTEGTDYALSYQDNVNASSKAYVLITGKNEYLGEKKAYFTIGKRTLKDITCEMPSYKLVSANPIDDQTLTWQETNLA